MRLVEVLWVYNVEFSITESVGIYLVFLASPNCALFTRPLC